jgi:hypothetical protein
MNAKVLTAVVAAKAAAILFLTTPAQALNLQSRFSPPPEQLDDDPIPEYILKPGQRLNVDYEINPFDIVPVQLGGWGNQSVYVDQIRFVLEYDRIELNPIIQLAQPMIFNTKFNAPLYTQLVNGPINDPNPLSEYSRITIDYIFDANNDVCNQRLLCEKQLLGGNFTPVLDLFWTFKGGNVNQFPGNGMVDLKVSGFIDGYIKDPNNAGNRINQQRLTFDPEFEVQDVPAPLPFLGVGVIGAFARRLRALSSTLKASEQRRHNHI